MDDSVPYIAYNTSLVTEARMMRKNPTASEKRLRFEYLRSRPGGYKRTRQKPLGPFIVDFYCSTLRIALEIDGGYHTNQDQQAYDRHRDHELYKLGVRVIRYTNEEVDQCLQDVITDIETYCVNNSGVTLQPPG